MHRSLHNARRAGVTTLCAVAATGLGMAMSPRAGAGECSPVHAGSCHSGYRASAPCGSHRHTHHRRPYRAGIYRCYAHYDRDYSVVYTSSRGEGPHYLPGRPDVRFYRVVDEPHPVPTPYEPESAPEERSIEERGPEAPRVIQIVHPSSGDAELGGAWAELVGGGAEGAAERFAMQAVATPRNGAPKVGFALAKLALGEVQDASWAMRRAFRTDAETLAHVPDHEEVRALARLLADGLAERGDEGFLLAALRYLEGDHKRALDGARALVAGGDDSEPTRRLLTLCEQREPERGAPSVLADGGS